MLGLAKRVKARILLASTSEIYGDPEVHPQPEVSLCCILYECFIFLLYSNTLLQCNRLTGAMLIHWDQDHAMTKESV